MLNGIRKAAHRAWKWLRRPSKENLAISTLDAIAFVALHGDVHDRLIALKAYRSFQREAKAGRLQELNWRMWSLAESITKELQQGSTHA